MVGIAPGYRDVMNLICCACQPSRRLLAPPKDHLHLKNVPADTNNGDAAVYLRNHKNPPKSPFRQSEHPAMIGIAPGYIVNMNLDSGACQPSRGLIILK
jgi:hypothetical protein